MPSLLIGRVRGIEIRLHPTFVLLPLWFAFVYGRAYGFSTGLRAVGLVAGVFVCVLFHELAHSLVAMRYRVRVPRIVLYPFGGVATLERMPREPGREFWIALAGPASNFFLAASSLGPAVAWIGFDGLWSPELSTWKGTIANLYWANLLLGLFNLIPAFPMDGGRILRAGLAGRLGYERATRISALCGRIFAILFFLVAAIRLNILLALIGGFVYASAGAEERRSRLTTAATQADREDTRI